MASAAPTVVVELEDSQLYESDLDLFPAPAWINDQVMNFCFKWMQHKEFAGDDGLYFMPATVALAANFMSGEDLLDCLGKSKTRFAERRLVFIPVNDADSPLVPRGGSHWALLCFDRTRGDGGTMLFIDSAGGGTHNLAAARTMAANLATCMDGKGEMGAAPLVVVPGVPQQTNGYDCGFYTIAFVHALASGVAAEELSGAVTPARVAELRELFHKRALALAEEKAKAVAGTGDAGAGAGAGGAGGGDA